jgi:hypothetical protein
MSRITKIQKYVGDYKITTEDNFYYLSKDGVSKFKTEKIHDSLIGSPNLNYNFKFRDCFPELLEMLFKQQEENSSIKDAYKIVCQYNPNRRMFEYNTYLLKDGDAYLIITAVA